MIWETSSRIGHEVLTTGVARSRTPGVGNSVSRVVATKFAERALYVCKLNLVQHVTLLPWHLLLMLLPPQLKRLYSKAHISLLTGWTMLAVVAALALQIAVDFVSPESMDTCLAQRQQLRCLDLALGEPTLQGEVRRLVARLCVLHTVCTWCSSCSAT
jgi:hypothetical protein